MIFRLFYHTILYAGSQFFSARSSCLTPTEIVAMPGISGLFRRLQEDLGALGLTQMHRAGDGDFGTAFRPLPRRKEKARPLTPDVFEPVVLRGKMSYNGS